MQTESLYNIADVARCSLEHSLERSMIGSYELPYKLLKTCMNTNVFVLVPSVSLLPRAVKRVEGLSRPLLNYTKRTKARFVESLISQARSVLGSVIKLSMMLSLSHDIHRNLGDFYKVSRVSVRYVPVGTYPI